ncbi:MAG TPA: hypothetical protein VF704_10235 [Allosphingosinicella sp.]|jgi:hypothetical protein
MMLGRLFPRQFDNRFGGERASLWLLTALVALKLVIAVNSILNTAAVASGADGFDLHGYGEGGAAAVLMLFALNAVGQVALALLCLLALWRYRSMVPFLYVLLLAEFIGRRLVIQAYAVDRADTASIALTINIAMLTILVLGLGLSLRPRKRPATKASR